MYIITYRLLPPIAITGTNLSGKNRCIYKVLCVLYTYIYIYIYIYTYKYIDSLYNS